MDIAAQILNLEVFIERLCTALEGLDDAGRAGRALPEWLTEELGRAVSEMARLRPPAAPHK